MTVLAVLLAIFVAGTIGFGVTSIVLRVKLRRARLEVARLEEERLIVAAPSRRRPPRAIRRATHAVKAVAETADLLRTHGMQALVASSIDDLTQWLREDRAVVERATAPDGTVTMFFSDIERSTELNVSLGDRAFMKVLARHDEVMRAAIEQHHGEVVKTQGDGFMVVFRWPTDALRAALEVQTRLGADRGRLRTHAVRVRIGVHRGAVVARDGDYFGRNVALAARVAAEAEGGEVLVSNDLREALIDSTEFVFDDVREVELKGFSVAERLWRVAPSPDDR
ncbi:adenylate/guanylate cyclase domain-containing protein [Aeromicrobium sp. Leaf350]|uniref:adenylate/guanylate cyclase domain-containing protein n=1 Tax=Aeromicrobium sp. Leaf350 TaxID=2876565 RepID=UPI001E3B0DFF|nr:adenylate/guanylate cyclase domain-containing protein [Aeromicrobium sp. Leaf350]